MPEKLKPCPACGSDDVSARFMRAGGNEYSVCCGQCGLSGPFGDGESEGSAMWQALPRRADASQGMSDGELIARTICWLTEVVACTHDVETGAGDLIDAELDRRAAARKESKP